MRGIRLHARHVERGKPCLVDGARADAVIGARRDDHAVLPEQGAQPGGRGMGLRSHGVPPCGRVGQSRGLGAPGGRSLGRG